VDQNFAQQIIFFLRLFLCVSDFFFLPVFFAESQQKAQACALAGGIDDLLNLAETARESRTKAQALRSLGQMCCFNEFVATMAVEHPKFIPVVNRLFYSRHDNRDSQVNTEVMYLLNVVAADSWK
jgi:hypothetical protein